MAATLVSVNAVGSDGRVAAEPLQVIPVGRNAHSIRVDESNKFVYVPTLGSDQIFQFTFDAKTGRLTSNTPAVFLMKPIDGSAPLRHSSDNKFVYVLSELLATVTTFSLDGKTGLLTEVSSASGLPPDSKLGPGAPRGAVGAPERAAAAQHRQRHLGRRHPHDAERQVPLHLGAHQQHARRVQRRRRDRQAHLSGSTPTEKQPRGFAIDPKGRFLVATGEKSDTISVYAIDPASGALQAYSTSIRPARAPTGSRSSASTEIVSGPRRSLRSSQSLCLEQGLCFFGIAPLYVRCRTDNRSGAFLYCATSNRRRTYPFAH